MKKLKESSLCVGDIILTSSTGKVSKAIRKGTKSDISHAMIYVQNHSIIDSDRHGVQRRRSFHHKRNPSRNLGYKFLLWALSRNALVDKRMQVSRPEYMAFSISPEGHIEITAGGFLLQLLLRHPPRYPPYR